MRQTPRPLADDGFSTRVLAALPPPTAEARPLRTALVIFAGLAGAALALVAVISFGGFTAISETVTDRMQTLTPAVSLSSPESASALLTAAVATVASLLYAFHPRPALRRLFSSFGL